MLGFDGSSYWIIIGMTALIGIFVTMGVSEAYIEPNRLELLQTLCPDMDDACLAKITIPLSPLYFLIPIGFFGLGLFIARMIALTF